MSYYGKRRASKSDFMKAKRRAAALRRKLNQEAFLRSFVRKPIGKTGTEKS
jgi:hypothetical protein